MVSDNLLAFLSRRFPEWSTIAIQDVQDITSGWETQILAFDIEYLVSDSLEKHSWIIRLFPGAPGPERARTEYRVYEILHELSFPIPKVILVETDAKWLGSPFIIMERIFGGTLNDLLQSGNETEKEEQIRTFAELFVKLHSTDWAKTDKIPDEYFQVSPRDMFLQRLEGSRKWVSDNAVEYLLPLIYWLQENQDKISFEKFSILHGDFHPMNILVNNEGELFVIDWTAARLGDYRSDLAWSMLLAYMYSESNLWKVIQREYEFSAGRKVENIDYFLIEASIRRLADILISIGKGSESMGMLAETEEEMRSSLPLLTKIHNLIEEITGIRLGGLDIRIEQLSRSG